MFIKTNTIIWVHIILYIMLANFINYTALSKVSYCTLYTAEQCPDEDDDVVHCSCFVLCDDEDCVLLSVMKC